MCVYQPQVSRVNLARIQRVIHASTCTMYRVLDTDLWYLFRVYQDFLTKISILSVLKQNIRASINEFGYQSDTSHDIDADTQADSSCITNHDTHGFIDMIHIMIQFFQFQFFRFSGENLRKIGLKWKKKWILLRAGITCMNHTSIRSGETESIREKNEIESVSDTCKIHAWYTCDTRVILKFGY